jgi:hypothetical protein
LSRVSPLPSLSTRYFARITIPGVQNPHCNAPVAANAPEYLSRSSAGSPSSVVTLFPATRSSPRLHATTGLPSTSTVQQPHCPVGEHPSLGLVTSSSSRSAASRWGCPSPTSTGVPFRTKLTVTPPGCHESTKC